MSNDHNHQPVPVTCSHCGHQFEQPRAWLLDHPSFRCPACDGEIRMPASPDDGDEAIGDALKSLGRYFRR
jgi:transcription initiation factor IIE alpha subunit